MESFINWSGFIGAWLLVAGSVYQAALELSEANDAPGHDRESRERAMASVPLPARISPWWWLLPPVGYVLNRRRTERFRREVIRHMDPEALGGMVEFGRKATSWLLVATGGFAIAIKETFELGRSPRMADRRLLGARHPDAAGRVFLHGHQPSTDRALPACPGGQLS